MAAAACYSHGGPLGDLNTSNSASNQGSSTNVPLTTPGVSYGERRRKLAEAWGNLQQRLRQVYQEAQSPQSYVCILCSKHDKHIIFCSDCGPVHYYCFACSEKVHRHAVFHVPQVWKDFCYIPVRTTRVLKRPDHQCDSLLESLITAFDSKGRQHTIRINFCSCERKAETLMRFGLWPSSPTNPETAVALELMELCRSFQLEGQISLHGFCSSMTQYSQDNTLHQGHQMDLYKVLSRECASQHRQFQYSLDHLCDVAEQYPDGTKCPICESTCDKLPRVISLDGNFRLVRKKTAGHSPFPGYHEGKLFLPDPEEYVPDVTHDEPDLANELNAECSDFKAGDVLRSKYRSSRLDITGVFGGICVHDYPLLFLNMSQGERLSYALAVVSKVLDDQPYQELCVLYDIGCKLNDHLKRIGNSLLNKVQLAVPLFHGFAHNTRCQVQFHPQRKVGYRLADGENMERLWSTLGEFATMTREMTPSNRQDMLTDVLIHVGEKNNYSAGQFFVRRWEKAARVESSAQSDLHDVYTVLKERGHSVTETVVRSWREEEEKFYSTSRPRQKRDWQQSYALMLQKWYAQQATTTPFAQAEDALISMEDKLQRMERIHKVNRWTQDSPLYRSQLQLAYQNNYQEAKTKLHREATERQHLILTKRNARGHETAAKVSKLLKRKNQYIMKLLRELKANVPDSNLNFDQVKDPQSSIYLEIPSINQVPYSLHRKAIDALNKLERAKEEKDALTIEITSLMAWHRQLSNLLDTALVSHEGHLGKQAMIVRRLRWSELAQKNLVAASKRLLSEPFQVSTPYLDALCSPVEGSLDVPYDGECDLDLFLELSDDDDLPTDDDDITD